MADLNRTGFLPAQVAREILVRTQKGSAIMQLAKRMTLPGTGASVPVVTAIPEAGWVGETGAKPVSTGSMTPKLMQAYKIAVIVPFSKELLRDAPALYDGLVEQLPEALAVAFDSTVIGAKAAPGSNFDQFVIGTDVAQSLTGSTGVYGGLLAAYNAIAPAGDMTGIAIGAVGKGKLLGALDGQNRPIFLGSEIDGSIPRVLGAMTAVGHGIYKAATSGSGAQPQIVGLAGDFGQAVYGTVEGVQISVSDQATLKVGSDTINLWQQNMVAVRAEIECGFRCNKNAFNLLTA
ncbi:MAG: phage major capsid protein [Firmicutes bacterium]|nr:phage major capsid protein [Bacillota bacterium]MBQ6260293.1 phage major capsid protein [Bacillota bacterium]MBR0114856.1 phage major capsid protein [Bacillota bacterium]MBR0441116.1 phage major capsid protein [Bacillota bacterium]